MSRTAPPDADWLEVAIETTSQGIDALCAYLVQCDTTDFVVEDDAEFQAFLSEHGKYWDSVDEALLSSMRGVSRVKFYIRNDHCAHAQLEETLGGLDALRQRAGVPLGSLCVSCSGVFEEDFANAWKQYYKPIASGERLYIVPAWEEDAPIPTGRVPLYLNPGLTFGTGTHASTRLCLAALEAVAPKGGAVLDLGCGSGILAIAALLLGAKRAVCVDVDPNAAAVSLENAALNQFSASQFLTHTGDVLTDSALAETLCGYGGFPLVIANIVADVIIPLCGKLDGLVAQAGVFLCSGIIAHRRDDVARALLENGFTVFASQESEGWNSLAAKRTSRG